MKKYKNMTKGLFIFLGVSFFIFLIGYNVYVTYSVDEMPTFDDEVVTYEQFGAVGDGKTNDIEAIRKAHDYANQKYLEDGFLRTVVPCSEESCSSKTYYIGSSNGKGPVIVITNVDWRGAKFIIDDYIDANKDGVNDVTTTESVFKISSPLAASSIISGYHMTYLKYDNSVLQDLSANKTINPNTTNLSMLIDYLFEGKVAKGGFYDGNVDEIEKYFNSSQRWVLSVLDNTMMYVRKGSNADNGVNQSDEIVIDSKTGDVLTDIDWTYDDIYALSVYPIPDNKISIGNGVFTTYTNNVVYTVDSSGNAVKHKYTNRNLEVLYGGNIELHDIVHYLDESKHPNSNKYQTISNANLYHGFISASVASYLDIKNVALTPHTPAKFVSNNTVTDGGDGTYDLGLDSSINVFIDGLTFPCTGTSDTEKNQCYANNIINASKWGVMGSNEVKNLFITNSKMNRIDAHRAVTNLYVADTTVGVHSLSLTGIGNFYGKNLKIDNADVMLNLRDDYGSSWNGTMVFDNVEFVVNKTSTNPKIVYTKNEEDWDFGFTTYFPNLYINGLTIDTATKGANVNYVTFLDMSTLYSGDATTVDKSNSNNLYNFKGNIYLSDLTTNGNTVKLFSDNFVNSSTNTLSKSNYGGSNVVSLYLDSDVSVQSNVSSSDKFKKVSSMTNKSQEIRDYFTNLISESKMPDSMKPVIGNIALSYGQVNEEISENVTTYTATVANDSVIVFLDVEYFGTFPSWKSKSIDLNLGENIVEFSVFNNSGERTNYTLKITRVSGNGDNGILLEDVLYDVSVDHDKKIIEYLSSGTKISDLLNIIQSNEKYKFSFYGYDGLEKDNDENLASGDKLVFVDTTQNRVGEYRISVLGDTNGDGNVTVTDVSKLFQYYRGEIDIEDYFVKAGDVLFSAGDVSVSCNDLELVLNDREQLDYVVLPNKDFDIKLTDVTKLYQYVRGKVQLDYYSSGTVSWGSNNTNVVTVSNGLVKSVSSGNTTITINSNHGTQTTCPVTVQDIRNAYDYIDTSILTGSDRNVTAINIAKELYPNGSNNVILIGNDDKIQGFLVQSLASALDAPVLLVSTDTLDSSVLAEITRLAPEKIYIVGGTGTVSAAVETSLKNNFGNDNVTRIAGSTRYDTAVDIAKRVHAIKDVNSVIIAEAVDEPVDTAIISFVSGDKNIPILYTPKDSLNSTISTYLSDAEYIENVYLVGGQLQSVIKPAVELLGKTVIPISGTDRFNTNAEIINEFYTDFNSVVLVNSVVDAMAASRLASKTNSVLIYSDTELNEAQSLLVKGNSKNIKTVYYLGGGNIKKTYRDLMYRINESNFKDLDDLLFLNNKVVFYVPHQDDETLFYSQAITSAIDRLGAENVFVVLVTDGNSSGAKSDENINNLLESTKQHFGGVALTFSQARDVEYEAALRELGVTNIQFVEELDFVQQSRFVDGTLLDNIDGLKKVMKAYDSKYGSDIVHIAYTPYFDYHDDHMSLGKALTELYFDTELDSSSFSNVYFLVRSDNEYTISNKYLLLLEDNSNNNKILNALEQFKTNLSDNPDEIRIGVGYTSVPEVFDLVSDRARNKTIKTKIHVAYDNGS